MKGVRSKFSLFFVFFGLQTVLTGGMWAQNKAPGGTPYTVEFWLKADAVQTSLPGDGANVTTWKDCSGNGFDFVRRNTDPMPAFKKVSDFNFQPSVLWSPITGNRTMTLASGSNFTPSLSKSYYLFVVSTPRGNNRTNLPWGTPVIQFVPNNNNNQSTNYQNGGTQVSWTSLRSQNMEDSYGGNRFITTALNDKVHLTASDASDGFDPSRDKREGIISWIVPNNANGSSGDIAAIYLNGRKSPYWDGSGNNGPQSGRGSDWVWHTAGNKVQLGQGGPIDQFPFAGEILEVILLSTENQNKAIGANYLHQMETYLALKYGITLNLGTGDATKFDKYVNSANQTVWIYDAAFNQKIFGIGRDDASGLYQKQSKSYEGSAFTAFVGNDVADLNVNNTTGVLQNMEYVVFGAAVPGAILDYGGVDGYPRGTLFDGVALEAYKGLNFRRNEVYKAMVTKNGVAAPVTLKLQVPLATEYVLVSKTTAFAPATTRAYEVKKGVVTITVDGDFKYIDFAGRRITADKGPGGVKRNMRLWLRADQLVSLNLVSQTNGGRGGSWSSAPGQPDIAQYEKDGLLRESSVDSWTSIVPGAGASNTYFPKYEYLADQDYSNRPGWRSSVSDLNYHAGVTFHRRGESTTSTGSNNVAAEYLVKNSNTDATKIFDQKLPERVTMIMAMIPEINMYDDATYILGFGTGNVPDYAASSLMNPLFGVNAQPANSVNNGARSFRYAEYLMPHNDQNPTIDGVVGIENIFDPHSTFIMSYYMRYNYNTAGDDTLKFGANGKYELSHSGRDSGGAGQDNYNRARGGTNATFNQYASIGAAAYRGRALKGNIGEVIFYEGQLTRDETDKINSYLALRYGITLKTEDYGGKFRYKFSNGTVIWDGENGTPEKNYHNNVAAVGRDDDSDFYNRQAHSTELNSMLHASVAGKNLSKNGDKSQLGYFDNDREAIVWGHNGDTGFRDVPQDACYKFAKMFNRTWLMKKTTAGNRAVPLLVGIQDNHAASSSQAMLEMYNVLVPENEFFMIIADSPSALAANNFKAVVPMRYLNGEFQCAYTFTEELTYVTFAYNQYAYPCVNHTDKEFEGVKTLDWTQWTRKNNSLNGSGVKTLNQPAKDLGDGITATTTIKYDDQVRANRNYPRSVTTPRGGIEIERSRGSVNSSKVTVTVEFNNPVYPEFFISGLDEWYGQKDQVTITGKCASDADDIHPVLSYANARTTRFTINGKKATVNRNGWASVSDASGRLNVVFDQPVKKVVIEYVITGRVYGSATQRIFISPLSLRSPKVPVPAPVINEDGLAFAKEVKKQNITTCEEVEYSFHITNTNFTEKYVNFRDVLPAGLTWKAESVGLDAVNAENLFNGRYLKIGNYAGTQTLTLDSLEIPCTSTIRITATAVPYNNLLQPGGRCSFSNRAQIGYERLLNNGQNSLQCILWSIDHETLDEQTVVNMEYTQARQKLILGEPVISPASYGPEGEVSITLPVNNPNGESVNEIYLDLNFDAGFTFKSSAGVTASNPNGPTGAVVVTPDNASDSQRTIAGNADGSTGFTLPQGITTIKFTLVAPQQADLVHQLDENGQESYKIAPLHVAYTYSSADMGDACIAKQMSDAQGEFEVPYFSVTLEKVEPAIGPNTGGMYTGSSATGNPYGIDANGLVTVKGKGFKSGTLVDVKFGGLKGSNVTVVNDNTITCIPPAVTSSTVWGSSHDDTWNEGLVDVTIFLDNNRIDPPLADSYRYRAPMTITGVSPANAPVGGNTQVTITGHNLLPPSSYNTVSPMPYNVFFDAEEVDTISVSNDQIVVKTKAHSVNRVDITTDNLIEKYITSRKPFTFYPTVFIETGKWTEYAKWEHHTTENILPPDNVVVHIKANCEQNTDVSMDSITVYPGVSYSVGSGKTVQSNVFTLHDDASFLNNGTDNIVKARVVHKLAQGRNWYVSSPMQGGVKPTVDASLGKDEDGNTLSSWRVEYYKEPEFNVWHPASGVFETGRGYTAYSGNEDLLACFTGKFTDGDQTAPVLLRTGSDHPKRGFNLVGNPFPSYWQWTSAAATAATAYSTIWYRTKSREYEFWSYNASGNIAVAPGWEDEIPNPSLAYIPPMQAFWVRLKEGQTSGTLTFSNSYRSHANNSMNILKSQGDYDKRPLLRLSVSGDSSVDEVVVYADPSARYGFDAYDSDKMFTGTGVEIFTLPIPSLDRNGSPENDNKLVINGLPAIASGMEIPLGFQAVKSGAFNIRAKEIRSLDTLDVFLCDRYRRVEYDLRNAGGYAFTAGSMPVTNRFSIVFRRPSVDLFSNVETDNFLAYGDRDGRITLLIYSRNMQGGRVNVSVFDITGRKLTEQSVMVGEKTTLRDRFREGVYVLRSGKMTEKVILNSK